jgi:hypothetical protein
LTEALAVFIMVLALSPANLTFKGQILGSSIEFTVGQLLPVPSSLVSIYAGAGIVLLFMMLFFSVSRYALKLGK